MTNGDRIRSMSDEELAEWFNTNVNFCWQCDGRGTCAPAGSECKARIKKWLKREEAIAHDEWRDKE